MGGCRAVQTLFRLLFQSELNYTAVCMCDFADIRTVIWHDSVARINYMSVVDYILTDKWEYPDKIFLYENI